jgi:hypothetical protein
MLTHSGELRGPAQNLRYRLIGFLSSDAGNGSTGLATLNSQCSALQRFREALTVHRSDSCSALSFGFSKGKHSIAALIRTGNATSSFR